MWKKSGFTWVEKLQKRLTKRTMNANKRSTSLAGEEGGGAKQGQQKKRKKVTWVT